jgi:hypothetical protein
MATEQTRADWPAWSGYAAAAWSLLYGLLGLYWTAGGDGFPFAPIDQAHRSGSVLEGTRAEVVAPVMAGLGLLGALVALAMARGRGRRHAAAAMIGFGWAAAAALTLFIPDYTMIGLIAFGPLLLVFAFTGVPGPQDGIGDILYWHARTSSSCSPAACCGPRPPSPTSGGNGPRAGTDWRNHAMRVCSQELRPGRGGTRCPCGRGRSSTSLRSRRSIPAAGSPISGRAASSGRPITTTASRPPTAVTSNVARSASRPSRPLVSR